MIVAVFLLLFGPSCDRIKPVSHILVGGIVVSGAGHVAGRCADPSASLILTEVPGTKDWLSGREAVPWMWGRCAPKERAMELDIQ